MKKILLIGSNGQVGWELKRTLAPLGSVISLDRHQLDLSQPDSIPAKLIEYGPDIIVNAAAYTAVDKAESEPDLAKTINGKAPGILAREAKKMGAVLVHYSTDYVFDGAMPHPLQENNPSNPLNMYGLSKLEGELAIQQSGCKHLIFRTSWVYASRGKNFLLTMLKLGKERETLNIVDDQIGAPTWSRMIAETTALVLAKIQKDSDIWGIYHLTSSGKTSWKGFAEAIFKQAHLQFDGYPNPKIIGIPTEAYPLPAKRPKNSVLSSHKLQTAFDLWMPSWESSLNLCMEEIKL